MSGDIFGGVGNIVNDAAGSLFGTKQGTVPYTNTSNSTTSTAPSALAQPYLSYGLQQARSIYDANQPNLAGLNQGQGYLTDVLNGKYLDPSSNPSFSSAVSDALGQAGSAFAGQYGGPAGQNLGNSGYQEALARGLGATATNAYSNAYQQERQNQMGAAALLPAFSTSAAASPYLGLQNYMAAINPALQFATQTNSGTQRGEQPYYQNQTAQTLGALAGGAGLLMMGK